MHYAMIVTYFVSLLIAFVLGVLMGDYCGYRRGFDTAEDIHGGDDAEQED